jgi:two-component system KDP operon response regulator KdpE
VTAALRALVVDDEPRIRRALEVMLGRAGYDVRTAGTAAEGLASAVLTQPDVILIDLLLPDGDGSELCRQIREFSVVPVLLLSAVDDEREKVRALDAGADDYLTKPFGIDELLARLRAIRRRRAPVDGAGEDVIAASGLSIDLARRRIRFGDEEVRATPTEFRLAVELVSSRGRVLTHEMLLRTVWGAGYADDTAVLRVHIARLRDKLEAAGARRELVETIAGVGYRLADEPL